MTRSRNIKPGFFTNGDLIECDPLARLLFAGLWCEADRRGILEDRPKTLKVKLLPGDNCDVDALLDELDCRGFIQRYAVDGIRCIHIPNFLNHQNPHVKEQANTLPAPDWYDASTGKAPGKNSINPADSLLLIPDSLSLDSTARSDERELTRAPEETPAGGLVLVPDTPNDIERSWAMQTLTATAEQIDELADLFRSYYEREDLATRKWPVAWKNWVLREKRQFQGKAPPKNGTKAVEDMAALARDLEARGL